jgi:hypothetical protein
MSKRAESTLIAARNNWHSLLKHYESFSWCDDGALGEAYSDAVVNLFAEKWTEVDVFFRLGRENPAFQAWALRHIDASASDDDLNKIVVNSAACTNKGGREKNICLAVRRSAEGALAESKTRARL